MKSTDQIIKWRLVLLTAVFSLLGFVLELGPVCGVFSLVSQGRPIFTGLTMELTSLGFLGYLALAAAAAVGLRASEEEPISKKVKMPDPSGSLPTLGNGDSVQMRERVRPELHQLRMLLTGLGGYVILKGCSLVLMWPLALRAGLTVGMLIRLFQFGFLYVALGWFAIWQYLRWFAQRRKWLRLQDELVGADVSTFLALIILMRPIVYGVLLPTHGLSLHLQPILALLLQLAIAGFAVIIFLSRPYLLRWTRIALSVNASIMLALTIALAIAELLQV